MRDEDFFQRANLDYLEDMYQTFLASPDKVPENLRSFFSGFDIARTQIEVHPVTGRVQRQTLPATLSLQPSTNEYSSIPTDDQSRVIELIEAYRRIGHQNANLSPLSGREKTAKLDLFTFGFDEGALQRIFYTGNLFGPEKASLKEIIDFLEETYCGTVGAELTSIEDVEELRWLQRRVESCRNRTEFDTEQRLRIYRHLYAAEAFEKFLHSRFVGQKRFSVEGLDSVVPMLHALVEDAANQGVDEVFLGMAHRGRLNVLTNVLSKPYQAVFSEFEGEGEGVVGDGDVKYHMGYSTELPSGKEGKVYVALNPNPSHLELVNPVILGKVYSRQQTLKDEKKERVIPLLLHGDAAFAGQGINMETLQLSGITGYSVGGTIHVIMDNQIGFTANSRETRSTRYPTDILKMAGCPVFHVNADDPESCVHVMRLALEYRQKFHRDVAIDLIGYRRFGHNEGDEPAFTQPVMYSEIRKHATAATLYRQKLVGLGVNEQELKTIESDVAAQLELDFERAKRKDPVVLRNQPRFGWEGIQRSDTHARSTGIEEQLLQSLASRLSFVPEEIKGNRKVRQFHEQRQNLFSEDRIDWAFAESLAFGSLLLQGHAVRLSGQDCQRGTFTQRNLVIHSEDNQKYTPLAMLGEQQAPFHVYNSILSELAVLGFEYGYALNNPHTLVLWEAQFGDFSNGAQSLIDNFLASGESKWQRYCGIVLMLPHGYEGAGPEHSSARLERYLQLCAEGNMRVANCTTPANYFHILRRQIVKQDRKPLILMTPKSLLRHRRVVSAKSDFVNPQTFKPVIAGGLTKAVPAKATRLLIMSGKIYYDILEGLEQQEAGANVYTLRLEQLYPFPESEVLEVLNSLPNLKEVFFVQEEKRNMGSWFFVEPLLRPILQARGLDLTYIGRKEGASPATGFSKIHAKEQSEIVDKALAGIK